MADVFAAGQIKERASIVQSKTQKPVRFEITEGTRKSLLRWMDEPLMIGSEYLWPGRFSAGTQLVREWNGKRYLVEVKEDGFLMNGEHFRSLSAIALHITGTTWSGPRFFGLNGKAGPTP